MTKYAVIFSSKLKKFNDELYNQTDKNLIELVKKQQGFISFESVRDQEGKGITISYWDSIESIRNWKINSQHIKAKELGKKEWYEYYNLKICQVIPDPFK